MTSDGDALDMAAEAFKQVCYQERRKGWRTEEVGEGVDDGAPNPAKQQLQCGCLGYNVTDHQVFIRKDHKTRLDHALEFDFPFFFFCTIFL